MKKEKKNNKKSLKIETRYKKINNRVRTVKAIDKQCEEEERGREKKGKRKS